MTGPRSFVLAHGLTALLLGVSAAISVSTAASFQGLGFLPGSQQSRAFAVSADGSVVVGSDYNGDVFEAVRWDRAGGMVGLGHLSSQNDVGSEAWSVNADGSVVVGFSANPPQVFRWDSVNGMVGMSADFNTAYDVAADGSIVVGAGYYSGTVYQAIRWDASGGVVGIGFLPGDVASEALAISADGSVIVGNSWDNNSIDHHAFRWDSINGMVGLGFLPGDDVSFSADISDDGSIIVGTSRDSTSSANIPDEAFRWSAETGMEGLRFLSGDSYSWATAANADGSVIVGTSGIDEEWKAFIWDAAHGMRNLQDVLVNHGLDLTGWALVEATGISADGQTIVGNGTSPDGGVMQAWIAMIPEPASGVLVLLALPLAVCHRRSTRATQPTL